MTFEKGCSLKLFLNVTCVRLPTKCRRRRSAEKLDFEIKEMTLFSFASILNEGCQNRHAVSVGSLDQIGSAKAATPGWAHWCAIG